MSNQLAIEAAISISYPTTEHSSFQDSITLSFVAANTFTHNATIPSSIETTKKITIFFTNITTMESSNFSANYTTCTAAFDATFQVSIETTL